MDARNNARRLGKVFSFRLYSGVLENNLESTRHLHMVTEKSMVASNSKEPVVTTEDGTQAAEAQELKDGTQARESEKVPRTTEDGTRARASNHKIDITGDYHLFKMSNLRPDCTTHTGKVPYTFR
ncbi:hypothetical protein Bbelb_163950 [Branchiostoma belcheri]|nr:hypothetical protein Bbelb_163950 [Branchiostoma belcheri]